MFRDTKFKNFKKLIRQSGEKQNSLRLAPISSEDLSTALSGITLNADQNALVELVVNTINSEGTYMVEYMRTGQDLSELSIKYLSQNLSKGGLTPETADKIEGGYTTLVQLLCGEGATMQIENGSLSLIAISPQAHHTNRSATLGHEVFGHGVTLYKGLIDATSQHVIPIQVENLILRNMGKKFYRDGSDHAPLNIKIPNFLERPKIY